MAYSFVDMCIQALDDISEELNVGVGDYCIHLDDGTLDLSPLTDE